MGQQSKMKTPSELVVTRLPFRLSSEDRRVITRPLTLASRAHVEALAERVRKLSPKQARDTLDQVIRDFGARHENIEDVFEENCLAAANLHGCQPPELREQRLLIGACLTLEYAIQSAALFNPSMVLHPDQSGVPEGAVRFVMSLRATGEGHVSSIVFVTGIIQSNHRLKIDVPPSFSTRARLAPDQHYVKFLFRRKLGEMSVDLALADNVLETLPDRFTLAQLEANVAKARGPANGDNNQAAALKSLLWLARANYQLRMPAGSEISDIVIFPQSVTEAHGVEDLRLVRFVDEDGKVTYYGTYTAYDGNFALPMLLETSDFLGIHVSTLNGKCAKNKGMALFPRRVGGHYCMCGRIDGQSLYIMYSDHIHFWESAELLARPRYPWELLLIGNCGSPLETPEGWLLLTHGVGPMRRYCIGAMLLDLEKPTKVIGRLRKPLLAPIETEREGYVPNVVYSCGGMIYGGRLYLPYAMSDKATSIATVEVDELLAHLKQNGS